jgi:molybdopterin-containing oxidoreductase family iron-sulfur binding subunit
VRTFNWFDPEFPEPLKEQLNPNVTVRTRGIMEKCTFCIQRIRQVEEDAKMANRDLEDGEVQPACAQSCPPGAIVFGNLEDEDSLASKLASSRRSFRLLDELGTSPAVIYLKGGETNV